MRITSSTVVSSLMNKHLYWLSSISTLSWIFTKPPFLCCRVNLHSPHGLHSFNSAGFESSSSTRVFFVRPSRPGFWITTSSVR